MTRRPLSGVLFLALAAVLAVSGVVEPGLRLLRWIVVAALGGWGIFTLLQKRERLSQVYSQILAIGLSIAAVGLLIPGSGSRGLTIVGLVLVLISGALLLRSAFQREDKRDDTHHSR